MFLLELFFFKVVGRKWSHFTQNQRIIVNWGRSTPTFLKPPHEVTFQLTASLLEMNLGSMAKTWNDSYLWINEFRKQGSLEHSGFCQAARISFRKSYIRDFSKRNMSRWHNTTCAHCYLGMHVWFSSCMMDVWLSELSGNDKLCVYMHHSHNKQYLHICLCHAGHIWHTSFRKAILSSMFWLFATQIPIIILCKENVHTFEAVKPYHTKIRSWKSIGSNWVLLIPSNFKFGCKWNAYMILSFQLTRHTDDFCVIPV